MKLDDTHQATHITNRISRAEWNSALARLPNAHILQAWEWGEFKSRHGWHPKRHLWHKEDQPCAAASTLTRRLGRWSTAVMYIPKGPALNYEDTVLMGQVLSDLEAAARHEQVLFVKMDPDVRADSATGDMATRALRRRGWTASHEQVQFRNTVILDLTQTPDEVLAAMKPKWRYNVRLAVRRGVSVRRGAVADVPLMVKMYTDTAARDGFIIRPEDYYRDAWISFVEAGLAQPLIAEVDGLPVAMAIIFHLANRAWYIYGASYPIHREKMPNHLLQWEAIRWAQEQGCTAYDMWGAPVVLNESDPLWGVYRFKQGFGGEFVRHIGAWDFPVSRAGYWTYTNVMPYVLEAMRWLYWIRGA